VPAAGSGANGVLVVAEFADKDGELEGDPLAGAAGHKFNSLIARAGYPRDEFKFHNVLSCRPPEGKLAGEWYENKAIEACRPNLDKTITNAQPKVVIALGNIALRRLTGYDGMQRYRGRPLPLLGSEGTWVVPTFHPSFLLPRHGDDGVRNPARFTGAVILDIKRAFHIKEHGFSRNTGHYLLDPPPGEFLSFILEYEHALRENPSGVFLSWDIETLWKLKNGDEGELAMKDAAEAVSKEEGAVLRISFSFRPGYAVTVPWNPSYMEGIKRLLASAGPKVTWNGWHFDEPTLRREGLEILGESHDGMWAWHLYQPDLDMGLEFVSSFATDFLPWKHLNSSQPELYSAIDPDAAIQNFLYTKKVLERAGQWDLYMRHVVQMEPIWRAAGSAGVHINIPKQTELREHLDMLGAQLTAEVQSMVPRELKPRKRYKQKKVVDAAIAEGREFEPVTAIGKVKFCSACGTTGVKKGDHFKGGKKNPCKVAGGDICVRLGEVQEWDEILPWNLNSGPQLKAYIRHHKHPLGTDPKDRTKQVADAKHLKRLIAKYGDAHPLYAKTLEFHKISKTRSTYLPQPDESGRIYTVYTNAPATWRTSSRASDEHGTNLQNWGKREDNKWAKKARETVVSKPGFTFVSADSARPSKP
jgi:uracil-DNA glycosylase family 4